MDSGWSFLPARCVNPVGKRAEHVGRTTRMGVEQYQDYTLYINEDRDGRRGRRLTDEQLCADWQHEFPKAGPFEPFHVKGVRRDFKKGRRREDEGGTGSSHGVRNESGEVVAGAKSEQY